MIIKRNFNEILTDNEENYFLLLNNFIGSVDEFSHVEISKTKFKYLIRIATSAPKYNNLLLEELLKFHNNLKIRLELSKSIKTSGILSYNINLS